MQFGPLIKSCWQPLLTLLYPPHCAMCSADLPAGVYLCETCAKKVVHIDPPFCAVCSQPFDGAIDRDFSCSNCAQLHFHFECAVARYRSRGVVRELLHQFKYQGAFHLRFALAAWIAEGLRDSRLVGRNFDFVVPVPLHPSRQRERQFNQAAVLVELLCKKAKVPVLHCLKRVRRTSTQTRLDRNERMENLRNAFSMRKNKGVHGKCILLVDDVFTTGSTVNECSRVLRDAGAASVCVLTVARG